MMSPNVWACPGWIAEALQMLRPPSKQSVSDWADENRVLTIKTSSMPGRWRTEYTPYLRGLMDAFCDPEVEEISFVKCTQVGGTEAILNMIGYVIDQDPAPSMVVYPTESLGETASQNRIQAMIDSSPTLKEKYNAASKRLELQFEAMYLVISGANSPSSLASYPVRYLFMDEIDKYPIAAGREADPRSLARERTKTYDNSKKIINVSTPTYEAGAIWQDWLQADAQFQFFVTCPHCGSGWTFKFKQLKFDSSSKETARDTAAYVCEECDAAITDAQKTAMVKAGEWRPIKDGGRRRVAYHLNSFYSPWLRFGDIAYEFVASHKEPALLMNFINSWLAEPFKDVETSMTAEWLYEKRQGNYAKLTVPSGTMLITGGVDVQKESFYWTIRAFMPNMTSYNLCHGKAYSWAEIEHAMNATYYDRDKQPYIVNLCCVDSGDQTDDVYDFCAINAEWAVAIKGASTQLQGRYRRSTIDRVGSRANGQPLYLVDTNHYKDTIYARMRRDEDDGGWYTHEGCDPEYCEMVTAEHKVVKRYGGRLLSVWEPKAVGRDNHYLDTEVYAMLAADLCGLRTLNAQRVQQEQAEPAAAAPPPPPAAQNRNNPLATKRGWFG